VNRRIGPTSRVMAHPLSILHCACFPENPWDLAAIGEIMSIGGFFGRIAWEDETPAGFALALDLGKECEILSFGVVPERRRAGIGSALLEAICLEARLRRAQCIVLEVAVDNIAAIGLYAARGFVQIGRRSNYYRQASHRVDALVLRLPLDDATIAP
jgi:[ribosomal protein S18]-alanine N-acetyltransferase